MTPEKLEILTAIGEGMRQAELAEVREAERARIRAAIESLPDPFSPPGFLFERLDGLVRRDDVLALLEAEE